MPPSGSRVSDTAFHRTLDEPAAYIYPLPSHYYANWGSAVGGGFHGNSAISMLGAAFWRKKLGVPPAHYG